eukprot:scaffold1692_cov177-Amphora_coffeaeformis.AAC.2
MKICSGSPRSSMMTSSSSSTTLNLNNINKSKSSGSGVAETDKKEPKMILLPPFSSSPSSPSAQSRSSEQDCCGNSNTTSLTDATCDLSEASSQDSEQESSSSSSSLSSSSLPQQEQEQGPPPAESSSYKDLVQRALKNYTASRTIGDKGMSASSCTTSTSITSTTATTTNTTFSCVTPTSSSSSSPSSSSSSSNKQERPSGNDVVLPEVPREYQNPRYFRQAILDCLPLYAGASQTKKLKVIQQILSEVPKRGGRLLLPPTWSKEDLMQYCQRSLGQLLQQVLSAPLLKNNKNDDDAKEQEEESTEIFLPESRRKPNPAFFKGLLSGCIYEYAESGSTVGQTAVVAGILMTLRRRKYTFRVPPGWTDAHILQSLHKSLQTRLRARGLSWVHHEPNKTVPTARPVSPMESSPVPTTMPVTTTTTTTSTATAARPEQVVASKLHIPDMPCSSASMMCGNTKRSVPEPSCCYRPYSAITSISPWCPPPLPQNDKKDLPAVGAYTKLLQAAGDNNKPKRKRRRTEPAPDKNNKTLAPSPPPPIQAAAPPAYPYSPHYYHHHHHPHAWAHHPVSYGTWTPPLVPSECVSQAPQGNNTRSVEEPVLPTSCPSSSSPPAQQQQQRPGMLQALLQAAATVDLPESAFETNRV